VPDLGAILKQIIIIKDDSIVINGKHTKWDDIMGIRNFDESWLTQIMANFPFSELFIRGGRVVRLKADLQIEGVQASVYDNNYKNKFAGYFTAVQIIMDRAKYIKDDFSSWIEWRLVLPSCLIEGILFLYCLIEGKNFESIVMTTIIGGILALPVGWFWKQQARRKLLK